MNRLTKFLNFVSLIFSRMNEIDIFYLQPEEPEKNYLLSARKHILNYNKGMTEAWKFNMPFFLYKGNKICYFRLDQKSKRYYLGFTDGKWIDHPQLIFEKRSRIKIFMLDPAVDLPVGTINAILKIATGLYDQ